MSIHLRAFYQLEGPIFLTRYNFWNARYYYVDKKIYNIMETELRLTEPESTKFVLVRSQLLHAVRK